jgi:glutaredoxin
MHLQIILRHKETFMVIHVDGTNAKNLVFIYTLSTCPWCKKTKALLNELKVNYDYIDIDLMSAQEQDERIREFEQLNPQGGFPTIIINNTKVIVGYKPDEIKKELK